MGILGINNRTENWKTVQHFHGLSDAAKVRLVRRLGEPKDTVAEEISIELFWHGVRDYAYENEVEENDLVRDLVRIYECLFGDLRDRIDNFEYKHRFQLNEERNYKVPETRSDRDILATNVRNTEVDVVLETRERIFIGEAKYESDFQPKGSHVLVHQLIRQFVTASVLAHLSGHPGKDVVSFVVTGGGKIESVRDSAQVEFMSRQGWLCKNNVLSWGDVNDIRIGHR